MPEVESLTGYVARLAQAHSVSTGTLFSEVLVPRLGRPYLEVRAEVGLSSMWRSSRAMNGTLTWARDMVAALEAVTGRGELRFLTMLPWAAVLDWKGLFRESRAWCAACYNEWRQQGKPIYEALVWTIGPVVMCPKHRQTLETRCPHPGCGRSLPFLSTRSRPGFCSRCHGWLGQELRPDSGRTAGERESREEWITRAVGQLLAAGPGLEAAPTHELIAESIFRCARVLTRGFVSKLARLCGIDRETVYQWLRGTSPGINMLLRACWHMGVSPAEFLTRPDSMTPTSAAIPNSVNDGWPNTPHRRRPREAVAIRHQLAALIEAHRPRSTPKTGHRSTPQNRP